MTEPQLTDDDIAQAARDAPIAKRSSAELERAAERFATATQERALRKARGPSRGARAPAWLVVVIVVVAASVSFVAGRVSSAASEASAVPATSADRAAREAVEVHAAPGASLDRVESGALRAARLYEGSATFSVPPASPSSPSSSSGSFVVVTGDAEVRGAGLFEVSAQADRIARVRVIDGHAEVKSIDGAIANVTPQAAWTPRAATTGRGDDASARDRLNAALALLSSGDLDKAAAAFKVEETAGSPVVEDATFWEAIALSRARRAEGRPALESFLTRFPRSSHRAEALGVLGWQLAEAGDARGAKAAFDEAVKSDDAHVRESAAAGLKKLGESKR